MKTGESVVSPMRYAQMMVENTPTDGVFVFPCDDAEIYKYRTGKNIIREIVDVNVEPPVDPATERSVLMDTIQSAVINSPRFTPDMVDRLDIEFEFFDRTDNLQFIVDLIDLIGKFKKDGTVWGVGRGSSCASLLMYVLEITDINPVLFGIPFKELSKESLD